MRPFIPLIVVGLSLGACDETDPAKAKGAAGSISSSKLSPAEQTKPTDVDDDPPPPSDDDGGSLTPTDQTESTVKEASRDAASGLPTGKRQHKPL